MFISGIEAVGKKSVFTLPLTHGLDPYQLAWSKGYRIIKPLSVSGSAPDLDIAFHVAPHYEDRNSWLVKKPRLVDVTEVEAATAQIRQRIAAYALVISEKGLLATQFSHLTSVKNQWGLAGGGIKDGENPAQAISREVFEETGQEIELLQFLEVHADHWIGRSPLGVIENFQAVRLVYAARCQNPTIPVVHDVGGTTKQSAWVPLYGWTNTNWVACVRNIISRHLGQLLEL